MYLEYDTWRQSLKYKHLFAQILLKIVTISAGSPHWKLNSGFAHLWAKRDTILWWTLT